MTTSDANLGDFSVTLRRQSMVVTYVAGAVLAIFAGIALGLPDAYQSKGVIRIDRNPGKDNSIVDTYAEYYIETLAGQVFTSGNLTSWVEEFDLYAGETGWTDSEKKAELRQNLWTSIVTTAVLDPNSGKEYEVVTGFEVFHRNSSPEDAKKVASTAVDAFLAGNRQSRQTQSQDEIDFFKKETAVYRARIAEVEERFAEFKERNSRRLPELVQVNMNALERVERDVEMNQLQISNLKRERVILQSQLSQIPTTSNDAIEQLAALQSEYVRVSSIYKSTHPNVVSIAKQIELLSQTVDSTAAIPILRQQQEEIAIALVEAREKYSEDHPDVRKLLRSENALKERIAALSARPGGNDANEGLPTNELYVQLDTQVKAIDAEVAGLNARSSELRLKRDEYEEFLLQTPQVEREYLEFSRDLDNARQLYVETQAKQRQAELSLALERSSKGEQLILVQRPAAPSSPAWPPRIPIFILGVILALGFGIGVASIRELAGSTVRSSRDSLELCGAPPIALIPTIYNQAERLTRRIRATGFLVGILAIGTLSFVTAQGM